MRKNLLTVSFVFGALCAAGLGAAVLHADETKKQPPPDFYQGCYQQGLVPF